MGRGPSQRSGTGRGTLPRTWTGRGTLPEVTGPSRKSGDPFGSQGLVGGPSRRYGTGRGNLPVVRDGSWDPLWGIGRVRGHSQMSGTFGGHSGGAK